MRIGINGSTVMMTGSLAAVVRHARQAAADGFASYWLHQSSVTGGLDALTTIHESAREAPGIEFGTAVVPTYPIHPAALASQALTVNAAIGGRLTLGIGRSHKIVVEDGLGMSYTRPIRRMSEYLTILQALLRENRVSFAGEFYTCNAEFVPQETAPPPVIVSALGEQMLRLTGRLADGTVLWLAGPRTIRDHIAPHIQEAAAKAGRPAPRIIASLPVAVTDHSDAVRGAISSMLSAYGELPAYRQVLDMEGAVTPGDVAIVGSEAAVREQLEAIARAGATDFAAVEWPSNEGDFRRTRTLLKKLATTA